jgi:hypothetical protein
MTSKRVLPFSLPDVNAADLVSGVEEFYPKQFQECSQRPYFEASQNLEGAIGGFPPEKKDLSLPFCLRPYRKNRKKSLKAPKTGQNGLFTRLLSVFSTHKFKLD